jgi:hypothetical protein
MRFSQSCGSFLPTAPQTSRRARKRTRLIVLSPCAQHATYIVKVKREKGTNMDRKYHLDLRAALLAAVGAAGGSGADLLNTQELAAWLAVSRQWAEKGRCAGYGPPFEKIRGKVRYRRGDVIAWLVERSRHGVDGYRAPTAQPPRVARRNASRAAAD